MRGYTTPWTSAKQAGHWACARHRTRSRISVCHLWADPRRGSKRDEPDLALREMNGVTPITRANRPLSHQEPIDPSPWPYEARGTRAGTDVLPLLSPHPARHRRRSALLYLILMALRISARHERFR